MLKRGEERGERGGGGGKGDDGGNGAGQMAAPMDAGAGQVQMRLAIPELTVRRGGGGG